MNMKRKIVSLILMASMMFCSLPAFSAEYEDIVITVDSGEFSSNGSFSGSSLKGYNDTSSVYDTEDDSAEAIFSPMLLNGGKYEIFYYNLVYSTNADKIEVSVYVDDTLMNSVELAHKEGESGLVSLGEYQIPAGNRSKVVAKKATANGFIRPNAVVYRLIEKDDSAAALVEINDGEYPGYSVKELKSRDITLPEPKENAFKIYMSPEATGGDGSFEKPYGTMVELQNALRKYKDEGLYQNDGICVLFREGVYALSETFVIGEESSATEDTPIFYMPYEDEKVVFTAGKNISSDLMKKVTDESILNKVPKEGREHLYEINLADAGIYNVPKMDLVNSTPYILVMGDNRGTLARWPNVGYGKTGEIIDTGARSDSGPRKKGFTYEISDARQLRWADEENGWLNGYWMTPYTINYASIADVDVDNMRIVGRDWNGLGNYGYARYFAEHLLSEIDTEGEWYIDYDNNKLYLYPFSDSIGQDLKFASQNFEVIKFGDTKNVVMKNIDVEVGGAAGVVFSENSENCMYIGGEVCYVSGNGISLNGYNNTVRDCDVSYVGAVGISVNGGNLYTLTPGNNRAENNEVHDVGTGGGSKQGITITGCSNSVANNHIYNILTHGISGGGMENIIEYNIVERTNLEMGDTGGIYYLNYGLGYGTIIRYNIVKDSVGLMPVPGFSGEGALGIYIDDCTSGVEIYGNVVYNAKEPGTFLHGGRYNKIYNNLYINCDTPINVVKTGIEKSISVGGPIWSNLETYSVDEEPYKSKYPQAYQNFTDSFGDPIGNEVKNNVAFNSGKSTYEDCISTYGGTSTPMVEFEGLPESDLTDFYDFDFSKIQEVCPEFEPIPFDQIGTYTGGERKDTQSIIYDNRADEFSTVYPKNAEQNIPTEVTLKWEQGKGGVRSYEVFISDDPEFKNIIYYKNTTDGEASFDFDYGTTYYWRVKSTPMLGYEQRWNTDGVASFTTISLEDALYSEALSAKALVNSTEAGTAPGMYPADLKEELSTLANEGLNSAENNDDNVKKELIGKIKEAKEKYMSGRIPETGNLTTLVYDDFENDVIGERPAGLFFRSYSPLNVKVSQDITNPMNKVFECRDEEATRQYGNRFFDPQDSYVEMSVSVLLKQSTGAFSVGLYKTGYYTTQNGTTGGCAARITFATDGNIYDGTNKNTSLMKYTPDTWYDIHVKLNLAEKYYDIYINGELVKEKAALDVSDVTSVNQFIFDTTDGNASTDSARGGYCLDNIIIRAPKSQGANPYLTSLSINGENVASFEPDRSIYYTDLDIDSLLSSDIKYTAGKNADVKLWKSDAGVFITVISGDCKSYFTYQLKAGK